MRSQALREGNIVQIAQTQAKTQGRKEDASEFDPLEQSWNTRKSFFDTLEGSDEDDIYLDD